ncbi:MAG TPA: hypothetical protein V6C81_27430 [Planktothrix sp.]|jgi:hypothetical protein
MRNRITPAPRRRNKRGNTLAFLVGLLATFLIALLLFSLAFVRFLGSHQQQVTAIESASLAAAKDLSTIVIEDPNLGFVGLSDSPPISTGTKAGDNFFVEVQSINTVLANARLNMIIADQLNDNILAQYAARDYGQAMQARQAVVTELQRVVQPGQLGRDADGNAVNVTQDAINAYNANPVNIDHGSTLVPGSLKLTLGWEENLLTNMKIPQPIQFAQMNSSQQQNDFYKAFTDVTFKGYDFVFAAASDQTSLVDFRNFRTASDIGALPYITPTVVRCEADQQFVKESDRSETRVVHAIACSQPSCLIDNRPAPGALFVSFPNGAIGSLNSLTAILTNNGVNRSPADTTDEPISGDYPPNTLSVYSLPIINTPRPPYGQCLRVALHDWIRRAGPGLNVQSLFDSMKSGLSTSNSAHADVFQVSSGIVSVSEMPIAGSTLPISNKQWYSVSGLDVNSGQMYDSYCTDYVFQPGRINGGIHAGEPLLASAIVGPGATGKPPNTIALGSTPVAFPTGPSQGAVRPTYSSLSVAVEMRFRSR